MQIYKYEPADEMFHTVYHEFKSNISLFANKILNDREEASDISIDSFIKLWVLRDSFSSTDKMKSFVYACTQNACLNRLKYLKRRKAKQYEIVQRYYQPGVNELMETGTVPGEAELMHAVKLLDKKCQDCIWLFYFKKMTCAKIASTLNVSERNVRFFLTKGRKMIKLALHSN